MLKLFACIALEHDYLFLSAAVLVCVLGSMLAMRLFARVRRASGLQRLHWLGMNGIVGGATIWTTHFVAMMGYKSDLVTGYDPTLTLLSLAIAVCVTTAGFAIAAIAEKSILVEAGGAILGFGIIVMHYLGMSAYRVQGDLVWDRSYVVASVIAGIIFGALATSRVARPITRLCRHGGTLALILAIVSAHFAGMTALTIEPAAGVAVPDSNLNQNLLMVVVLATTLVIMALGASTYAIDQQTASDAVERYRHLSLHDALTGLWNRIGFLEQFERAAEKADLTSGQLSLLLFGLNRFKEVNDVHGHSAGDAVLRGVAERISGVLRDGEFAARIGGDEFVVVNTRHFSKGDATGLAQRLIRAINQPTQWAGQQLTVGASVGIAAYPADSRDPQELLAQADVAMYRAKAAAPNTMCFYDLSMDQAARERSALAMDMRGSLRRGEFELYYQVQNDVGTGAVIGFEVLLRWNHPRRGQISPAEFIPIAEKTGLILELGDWVLYEACKAAAQWRRPLGIAVNVAPQQLANSRFPSRVLEILNQTGLTPSRLELEITESGIIADQQNALHIIRQLKSLGVKIAMDDYGTGYSSLSTLQSFPFDKIKIDRGFIQGLTENKQSVAIVRSTLILAASLDIPVLAEGVETDEHVAFLAREGCQQAQGYHYGKPVSAVAIAHLVNGESTTQDEAGESVVSATAGRADHRAA